MSSCLIRCVKPGILSTLQDQGRVGYQKFGVPQGGAMDKRAAKAANWLVGNDSDAPVLEITFAGPTLHLDTHCQIGLTGADISPHLNGIAIPNNETVVAPAGSTLSFGKVRSGCRAYLSIGGKWKVRKWLESVSAPTRNAALTTPDSILMKDDFIKVELHEFIAPRSLPSNPVWNDIPEIRILPGPEFGSFDNLTIARFFSVQHRISPQSNRMGYRLQARLVDYQPKEELISSPCLPGTIQLTNEGQVIVLMADAQTIGGYPRIGQVIGPDLDLLAQGKPGDTLRFRLIDLDAALLATRKYQELTSFPS